MDKRRLLFVLSTCLAAGFFVGRGSPPASARVKSDDAEATRQVRRSRVPLGAGPLRGPDTAKVTIIEFMDYECPFSVKAAQTLEKIVKTYGNDVRVQIAHHPLPFHANAASTSEAKPKAPTPGGFDYEKFYTEELEKKHQDASYRYFNNINRMANKFPIAHTGDPKDEVEVWCANDYLGMGNNPVVLETMQCVISEIGFSQV